MTHISSFAANAAFEQVCARRIKTFFDERRAGTDPSLEMLLVQREGDGFAKQGLDATLQKQVGDAILHRGGCMYRTVDFKCERRSSPNLFIETHSNMDPERYTPGWLYHLRTDELWYLFADTGDLTCVDLHRLKSWLHEEVPSGSSGRGVLRLMAYPEVLQRRHAQLNKTVGRLVPLRDLTAAPGVIRWRATVPDETACAA